MTTLREAAQQALEALEEFCEHQTMLRPIEKRESLKAALAEPQEPGQEPVQEPWGAGMKPEDVVMTGVREYAEGYDVILSRNEQGRWLIEATNEGGHNGTAVDLLDLLQWLRAEPVQEPVAWLRVIDEAMVTHHLGVADPADDYETAKRKMNNLLCMAQDIGTYFAKQAEPAQEPVHGIGGKE